MNKELKQFEKVAKQRKRRKAYEKQRNIMRNRSKKPKSLRRINTGVLPVAKYQLPKKKVSLWRRFVNKIFYGKKAN